MTECRIEWRQTEGRADGLWCVTHQRTETDCLRAKLADVQEKLDAQEIRAQDAAEERGEALAKLAAAEKRATDAEAKLAWAEECELCDASCKEQTVACMACYGKLVHADSELCKAVERATDAEKHDAETADKWLALNQLLIRERALADRLAEVVTGCDAPRIKKLPNGKTFSACGGCAKCAARDAYNAARKS